VEVRPEGPGDAAAVRAVHAAGFPTDLEARLVDRLRGEGLAHGRGTGPLGRAAPVANPPVSSPGRRPPGDRVKVP
jgi:hypothetical protein